MKTRNVTITSKNQITLPAEYAHLLQLAHSRVLKAELQGGSIILTPQPSLADTMQPFWAKHSATHALTDTELTQAARGIAAKKAK